MDVDHSRPLLFDGVDDVGAPCACDEECDVVLGELCRPMRLFGLAQQNTTARKAYRVVVFILCGWSFIGWLIRCVHVALGERMGLIPGWFEVSTSDDTSIPSALFLSICPAVSLGFGLLFFTENRHRAKQLIRDVFLDVKGSEDSIKATVRRLILFFYAWTAISAVVGRVMTIVIASTEGHNWMREENPGLVVYDTVMTVAAFTIEFGIVTFMSAYVCVLCSMHVMQVNNYAKVLRDQSGDLTVEEIVERHRHVVDSVRTTAALTQTYLTVLAALSGIGTACYVVNMTLRSFHRAIIYRGIFCMSFIVPIVFALYSAARVSRALSEVVAVAHRLPLRKNGPGENAYLLTFYLTADATGELGFSIFGVVMRPSFFSRLGYAIIVIASSLVQYQLRREN